MVEQLARRGLGKAEPRLKIAQHIVDDHFHIIGIDFLLVDLILAADEVQLVVIDLRDGGDVFLVGDVILIVHLVENGLGALLVVLHAGKGTVARGVVRDADDARALRQREILHVFAEVGLRRHLHAACALAEVDDVEVPLHDLFLGVFLFEIESAENLHELSLHGDVVFRSDVFDELLRDRRAAEVVFHAEEHVDERARRAVPVHALVVIEALVLDGDRRLFQIRRQLVVIDPDAVLVRCQHRELYGLAVVIVRPDRTRERDGVVLERDVQIGCEVILYIVGENAREEQPAEQQHEQHREHDADNEPHHISQSGNGGVPDGEGGARTPRNAGKALFARRFFPRFFRVRLLLRLRRGIAALRLRRAVLRGSLVFPRRGQRHRIAGYGRHRGGIAVRYIVVGAFLIHNCLRDCQAYTYNNKSLYHTFEKYCIRNGNFLKQVH